MLYTKDPTSKTELSAKECIPLLIATLLGALYIVSTVKPARMDADIVVSTLASLKNPTLYYWGQDRLFSLVPIMLLPFRNIEWNLYFNTFFHAAFFSALILLILRSIPGNRYHTPCLLIATLIALNYTIPTPELFTFAKHAQPYAASTVFMIAAFYINTKSTKLKTWNNQKAICASLAIISLLLNPLTILLGFSLLLSRSIVYKMHWSAFQNHNGISNLRWLAILFLAFLVAAISKSIYSQNYDIAGTNLGVDISNFTPALIVATGRLIGSFKGNYIALFFASLGFLTCLYTCLSQLGCLIYHRQAEPDLAPKRTGMTSANIRFYEVISCAAILNLFSLIPILSSEWYRLNDYSLRYIFPAYLAIIVGLCRIVSYALCPLLAKRRINEVQVHIYSARAIGNSIIFLGLASSIAASLIGSFRPIAPDLLTYNEFSQVQPIYSHVLNSLHARDNIFIGGSYWLSWPFKALGLREGYDIGVITDRSRFDPVSRQREDILDDHIKRGKEFTFICLSKGQDSSNCESFLKSKIERISGSSRLWELEVSREPITYSNPGEIYATKINYKAS